MGLGWWRKVGQEEVGKKKKEEMRAIEVGFRAHTRREKKEHLGGFSVWLKRAR